MRKCPDCSTENPPDAEFCRSCAHPLTSADGVTRDPSTRQEIFGGEGVWLDKSVPETQRRRSDPQPRPGTVDDATGELELAMDPQEIIRAREAVLQAERRAAEEAMKGPPPPELTARAIIVGLFVAAFVGASFPYVVLKIGFGPNISVVSAFLGYLALLAISAVSRKLSPFGVKSSRVEYNIVQTAGTAAGQTAFMCILLAAFDLLASKPQLHFTVQPSGLQVFLWLSVAGCLGVLMAVPLRRHFIDQENLTFADGVAAGETLLVLDEGGTQGKRRLRWLTVGGVFSAAFTWLRDGVPKFIPDGLSVPERMAKLHVGADFSPLSFGSGLLVGLRITMSMAIGMVIAWFVLPQPLFNAGITSDQTFAATLRWVMWPATGLMVSGGLTALALKWRLVAQTFVDLRTTQASGTDVPLRWVIAGCVVLSVALVSLQKLSMGIPVWQSVVAILVSIPLMLVGVRVLGETNWAPISAMANMVQAVFAVVAPGNVATNMVASGMSGTVAGSGEFLMQDYKAGKIIGSSNRYLTYMQLLATPVGAAALALVYPLLRRQYGIGPDRYGLDPSLLGQSAERALSSPISVKWAGFAELLAGGISALPRSALYALILGVALGVVITVFEERFREFLPSPTGIALGMLIPASSVIPMVAGGVVQMLWHKGRRAHEEELSTPLASGLIVGEAMLALIIPLLAYYGVLSHLSEWMLPFTNWVNERLGFTLHIEGH